VIMRWTDINSIAIALEEKYPEVDIMGIRFTDLHQWVLGLDGFNDEAKNCNEKVLEAIQATWLEERD